jgi:ABC-2 type transport system permease protein
LVVIGSGDFLNDTVFNLSSQLSPDSYLNSLQLVANAVDWSVEDLDLLGIRARGAHARILDPLNQDQQSFWEFLNYAIAIAAVVVIGVLWAVSRRREQPMELTPRGEIREMQEVTHAQS